MDQPQVKLSEESAGAPATTAALKKIGRQPAAEVRA
jgi:hypothetical protein